MCLNRSADMSKPTDDDLPSTELLESSELAELDFGEMKPKDRLAMRIAHSKTPEKADKWQQIHEKYLTAHRREMIQAAEIALGFLRFVAILGLGCALLGMFEQPELGVVLIGYAIAPKKLKNRITKAILEDNDEQ